MNSGAKPWHAVRAALDQWAPTRPTAAPANPFRQILGAEWRALPAAVQARFARHVPVNACVSYAGEIIECRMSRAGWWLAQLARIIGAPLPLSRTTGIAAHVTVTGASDGKGQHWTRHYGRHGAMPQVIHSTKRFAGPTGIEEYLGYGIGIALSLRVEDAALLFTSDHLFCRVGPWRLRWPRWLQPGQLTIGHVDLGTGRFAFTLDLHHPLLGELMHQVAVFADQPEGNLP
jgi:hypothetical protein